MRNTKELNIRFADIDVMGHVNNAIYLSYFEEGRMSFFEEFIGNDWNWKTDGIVLARNEVDYRIPIRLNDIAVIDTWMVDVGRKSLTFSYLVHDGRGKEYALGKSVLVCYNYEQGLSQEVPEKWRSLIFK